MHLIDSAKTFLFVPGDRPARFEKAWQSTADAIILDLEDAVTANNKLAARQSAADWLRLARPTIVRINDYNTPWFKEDLALLRQEAVCAIMVPKANDAVISAVAWHRPVIALIESAEGLATARAIAANPAVSRLAFGALDFALDLNFTGADEILDTVRLELVIASRTAGIAPPVDGVTVEIADIDRVHEAACRARRLGFGGKLCIHPAQLEPAERAFYPTPDEITWAETVVQHAGAAGASNLDGVMIDEPVRRRAQRILELARTG